MSIDDAWIKAAQHGDRAKWRKIVDYYGPKMRHLLLRFSQDRWEIEDICQEVWLRVYRKIHLYNFDYPFYSWVLTVTTNVAINYKRKKKWWEVLQWDVEGKKAQNYTDFLDEVQKPLSLLTPTARIIFLLYHYESYTAKEIGEIMSLPVGTVKSHLSRSTKLLQKFLCDKENQ